MYSMSEWTETTLGEISDVQTGPFGSQLHESDYVDEGTPMITVEHLLNNRISNIDTPKVSDEDKQRLIKYTLKEGDIVFSRVGSVDRCSYVSQQEDGWMFSGRLLRVRVDIKKADARFLSFYLMMEKTKQHIRNIAVGSTMPSLNTSLLEDVPIVLPSLTKQQSIAAILSSLDNKIDLLRRQNQTLEQLAQTIFKQWFVLFQYPGANGKMQQTELGEVPVGWRVGRLIELFELQRGFDLPSDTRTEGIYPVIAASGFSTMHNEYKLHSPGIVTGQSGVIGNVFYIQEDFWPLNTTLFIKSFNLSTPLHAYFVLLSMDLSQFNSGSAVPSLNRNHVHETEVILPAKKNIEHFEETCKPFFRKIFINEKEIQTLTQLRDSLLPRLMSGRLRVV